MEMRVKIGSGHLPNPVGIASGTFGYGSEYSGICDFSNIGAVYTKAVTMEKRSGNKPPRLIETPSGLLNSIGLANVGVDKFISDKLPFLSSLPSAVIVNIAGKDDTEYTRVIKKLEKNGAGFFGYEINISCPNVRQGGMALGTDPSSVEKLTAKIRKITEKPLIIKLTPNVTDIASIAKAAQNGGADAVSCINTLIGMVIDVKKKKPFFHMKTGGLSGPAVRAVGVAAVYAVSRAVDIPVIGIGGITSSDDALQYFLAGASAIQVGTGIFTDPAIPEKITEGLKKFCNKEGIKCPENIGSLLKQG